jgi:NAD(P)H dehydrogenase (quinone)
VPSSPSHFRPHPIIRSGALLGNGHSGHTYDTTGPEYLSINETAAILAGVTQQRISYYPETVDEAWASRRLTGAPDWEIECWITSYLAVSSGEMDVVSDSVQRLTGHSAEELEALSPHASGSLAVICPKPDLRGMVTQRG